MRLSGQNLTFEVVSVQKVDITWKTKQCLQRVLSHCLAFQFCISISVNIVTVFCYLGE